MARRGTEAFPDLGAHCDEPDRNQLDGCGGFFCAAHRDHGCAKAADDQGRTVVVCPDCDPARKRKPRCPARRCKEALTFSNTSQCNRSCRYVAVTCRRRSEVLAGRRSRCPPGASRSVEASREVTAVSY